VRGPSAFLVALHRAIALAPALSLTLQLVGLQPAQAADATHIYQAVADPISISLCPGLIKEISVHIRRTTLVNGQVYAQRVGGGRVIGLAGRLDIGHFNPVDPSRVVGGPPESVATFEYKADKPGTTEITFAITSTGEEARVGGKSARNSAKVRVEVTDCYEAYTSGLATVFTQKWMDKLRYPFFLAGYTPNVKNITAETQYMLFFPNPHDRLYGSYVLLDTHWVTSDPRSRCTAYISGRYDVVFYPNAEDPVEGDLMMKGSGEAVCKDVVIPIDYELFPGFQIAFRPAPPFSP
jgi:hypothetical protein